MPSMPLARKATVTVPPSSNASSRGASRSASVDSLMPQVRRVRLAITVRRPWRASRSGITARCTISRISWGTPGTA